MACPGWPREPSPLRSSAKSVTPAAAIMFETARYAAKSRDVGSLCRSQQIFRLLASNNCATCGLCRVGRPPHARNVVRESDCPACGIDQASSIFVRNFDHRGRTNRQSLAHRDKARIPQGRLNRAFRHKPRCTNHMHNKSCDKGRSRSFVRRYKVLLRKQPESSRSLPLPVGRIRRKRGDRRFQAQSVLGLGHVGSIGPCAAVDFDQEDRQMWKSRGKQ